MSIILKASYSDDSELKFVVDALEPNVEQVRENGIRSTKKGIFKGAKIVIKNIPKNAENTPKHSGNS